MPAVADQTQPETKTPPPEPKPETPLTEARDALVGGDDNELRSIFNEKPAPAKTPKVEKEETKAESKPEEKSDKSEAKPDKKEEAKEPAKEEKKEESKTQPEVYRGAKEMRQAIESRDKRLSEIQSERDRLNNELSSIKTKIEKGELGGDTKALSERLASMEKELADARATVAEYDYSRSPEFEQKFLKPYASNKSRAVKEIENLDITLDDGTTRKANSQDFDALLAMPRLQARKIAKQVFGDDYDVVVQHINKLHEIRDESQGAIEEHRTSYDSKRQQQMAEQARHSEWLRSAFTTISDELTKKNPDFQPSDGDDEGNTTLNSGFAFIDNNIARRETMTPQERLVFDATVRLKAGAFDRTAKQRDKLKASLDEKEARIAELESRIKDLEDGGPGPSRRQGEGSAKKEKSVEDVTPQEAGFES